MIKKTIEEDSSESEDWCNVDSDYEGAPIVRPITSGVVVLEPGFVVEADGNVSDMDMPKMRKEASQDSLKAVKMYPPITPKKKK